MERAAGIIVSISIIAALGIAVLENPQVSAWLEEQRKKIAELLRSIGEELDPQTRRQAEAFAFEGRTVVNDESIAREAEGSEKAAALATGRALSNASPVRRIPVHGPLDQDEAEERRRKGREYLARRNQQLLELQQRRKAAAQADGSSTPKTPTFDELVDSDGKLKETTELSEKQLELPELTHVDPIPEPVREEMMEVERQLAQPIPVAASSSSLGASGWSWGSVLANPFADEYAIDRSITPRPPVPPKIELDKEVAQETAPDPPISIPGSFSPIPTERQEDINTEGLSYEEQLAIALSLSEQDRLTNTATVRQTQPEDDDDALRAAIAASLKDMDDEQGAHAATASGAFAPQPIAIDQQPLVDISPSTPPVAPRLGGAEWKAPFNPQFSPSHEPLWLAPGSSDAQSEASDELYRLTPELTKARLASHNAQQTLPLASSSNASLPFDPVRDALAAAAATSLSQEPLIPDVMDSSFYSAPSNVSAPPSTTATFDRNHTAPLIDVSEDAPVQDGQRTPTSRAHSSFGFQTDLDTDTETWASASGPASRARSEVSGIEVLDLVEDSDVDMLSEEGDGVATPDSWSEVGSRDADSDGEEESRPQQSMAMGA